MERTIGRFAQLANQAIPHHLGTGVYSCQQRNKGACPGLAIFRDLEIRSFTVPESHFAAMVGMTFDTEEEEWQEYDGADSWKG